MKEIESVTTIQSFITVILEYMTNLRKIYTGTTTGIQQFCRQKPLFWMGILIFLYNSII